MSLTETLKRITTRYSGKKKAFVAGLLALLFIIPRLFFADTTPTLGDLDLVDGGGGERLFVVLHAFTNEQRDMKNVHQVIRKEFPQADIFSPTYNAGITSNISLQQVARQLDAHISRIYKEKQDTGQEYSEIIIVGHSIGALLARKSYLFGIRFASDGAFSSGQAAPAEWTRKVSRFVLLAGMNRGWTENTLSPYRWLEAQLGRLVFGYMGLGKMIFQAERGAPFVSNLKIDWFNYVKTRTLDELPVVVQLLGEQDQRAPLGDHKELVAAPNFVLIDTPNTNHGNVIEMDINSNLVTPESIRGKMFREAISEVADDLRRDYPSNTEYWKEYTTNDTDNIEFIGNRTDVRHVVFVLHGIRDHGEWVNEFNNEIKENYPNVAAVTSAYGYFSMARFLIYGDRDEKVKWFVDQYTEAQALFPNATEFSFIGHSNGTYLLAKSLERYDAIKFDQVYFAGSVVRRNFEWNDYKNTDRIKQMRNDVSVDDWVVAWFPKFYQIIQQQLGLSSIEFFDLGSGGFNGFSDQAGKEYEGFVIGGHGAALEDAKKRTSILKFVIEKHVENLPRVESEFNESKWVSVVEVSSNLAWVIWLLLITVLLVLGILFCRLDFVKKTGEKFGNKIRSAWMAKQFGIVVYLFLILMTLYTV